MQEIFVSVSLVIANISCCKQGEPRHCEYFWWASSSWIFFAANQSLYYLQIIYILFVKISGTYQLISGKSRNKVSVNKSWFTWFEKNWKLHSGDNQSNVWGIIILNGSFSLEHLLLYEYYVWQCIIIHKHTLFLICILGCFGYCLSCVWFFNGCHEERYQDMLDSQQRGGTVPCPELWG